VGGSSFRGKKHYVFSNSLESAKEKDVQLISGDFVSQVREIQKQGGKDIWLYGGASLTTSFMNEGLIDEMWLGLVPVVLGSGKLLFQNINQRNYFRFLEATQNKGYVSLRLGRKEK
jgi:dihydrofolate reductase